MGDMFWLIICAYLSLFAIGGYFLWRAYQLGIKKNLRYAKGPFGIAVKHPREVSSKLAFTELLTGVSLIALVVAIPVFSFPLKSWSAFVFTIAMFRVGYLNRLASK